MKNMILLTLTVFILIGCGAEEKLIEKTQVQAKEEIRAQNENLEAWSGKLEADLEKRRLFISAVVGTYEGELPINGKTYMIRFKIIPTIPDYLVTRTRTLSELEYEIQNLNLNIHILQWNPSTRYSAVGCVFENVRPDLKAGRLNLVGESCKNTYDLYISDGTADENIIFENEAINVVNLIYSKRIDQVNELNGFFQSSSDSKIYKLKVKRI